MSSPLIPWAGMDPGEVDDTACGHIKHKNVGCASCTARETEDDSIADEEDTDDEDIAEIEALRRRRAYIVAQLYNVGQSIRDTEAEVLTGQGLPEIPKRNLAPKDTVDESNTASFLHTVDWRSGAAEGPGPKPLTDRAEERVKALLDLFDADGDGCLSFDEFRAYMVKLGRHRTELGKRLTTNRDFWLIFVTDQAGPAAADDVGGTVSSDGRLTLSGFIGHRRMVEAEHPLELDLLSLGLDLLPEPLQRWQSAKEAFDSIDLEASSAAVERGEGRSGGIELEGAVDRGEAQLLLADSGEIMTHLRVEEELTQARWRARLILQVIEEKRKKNRLAQSLAMSRGAVDPEKVYRSAWLAWLMSGRAREDGVSWLEKGLVRLKNRMRRGLRNFSASIAYPRRALENMAQQGMISSVIMAPLKSADTRATARLAVGDPEDDGTGFSISLNFLHKGNASLETPVEALPPGVGLSLTLDLEVKDGASDKSLGQVTDAIEKVLRSHVIPEVKRSPVFHSLRVNVVRQADRSQVVRMSLFWRSQANIDFVCRQFKLGLRPTDLVRELTMSFFCPIQLSHILESDRLVLNKHIKFSLSAEACFCGPLASKFLEEAVADLVGKFHQAAADSSEHDDERRDRKTRTDHAASGMEHPLVTPKRQVSTMIVKGSSGSMGKSGTDAGKAGRGRLRTEGEKRREDAKTMRWFDKMWSLTAKLKGTKAFTLDLEADTPLEFLDSGWARAHLPASWRSEQMFTEPGQASKSFLAWKEEFLAQAMSLGQTARDHQESNRVSEEASKEKAADIAKTDEGQRLADLEEELAKLGVSRALLTETMGEKEEESVKRLREAKDKKMKEYADLNEALRACVQFLLGPRELRLQSGPNVLVVEMQGLDMFEVLSAARSQADIPGTDEHGEGSDEDDLSAKDTQDNDDDSTSHTRGCR